MSGGRGGGGAGGVGGAKTKGLTRDQFLDMGNRAVAGAAEAAGKPSPAGPLGGSAGKPAASQGGGGNQGEGMRANRSGRRPRFGLGFARQPSTLG